MTALVFALGVAFLLLAAHPFVTYPLSLMLLRRLRPAPIRTAGAEPRPAFSICVCAHNEAGVIRDKLANLLALRERTPGLEILVYDDASSDGTALILSEYKQHDVTVVASRERTGKTVGMNRLVAMSRGDVVVFSDANVTVVPDALAKLEAYFADPEVGCVCGHLRYLNRSQSVTAATGSDYWRLEEFIKQLESDTGSVMGADGSLFALRRSLHRPVPEDLIDDMYVSFGVLLDGYRVVRAPDVLAFENSAAGAADEFRRKIRIACQAFNVHRRLWPRLRRLDALNVYKYVSHKLLRWLTVYSLALAGVFFLIGFARVTDWRFALGAAALVVVVLGLGHTFRIPPFNRLVDVLLAMVGTGLGVLYSIRGREFRTWTPAASVRGAK